MFSTAARLVKITIGVFVTGIPAVAMNKNNVLMGLGDDWQDNHRLSQSCVCRCINLRTNTFRCTNATF